jgi:ribosome biogenesis ATPase
LNKLRLAGPTSDYTFTLARATPGYVGADLASLTSAAGVIAVKRIFKGLLNGEFKVEPQDESSTGENGTTTQTVEVDNKEPPTPLSIEDVDMVPSDPQPPPSTELPSTSHISPLMALLRSTPLTPAQLAHITISMPDFLEALATTQPSATREGFTTRPDVSWADIGALKGIREELEMAVVWPIRRCVIHSNWGDGWC